MINAQVYGLNKCSTCHKAMAWLDEHGVAYQFADYRDNPIDSRTLCAWASAVGGWEKLVNRASMTWRNLPLEKKSPQGQEQWLALIAQFPALIRRPVLVLPDKVVPTGFSDKKYGEILTLNSEERRVGKGCISTCRYRWCP